MLKYNNRLLLVEILANDLMKKYKVDYLSFRFSKDKEKLGYCTIDYISIQTNHAVFSEIEDVKNTILHEIAHALAGLENNHNNYWQSIAEDIGVEFKKKRYNRN